VAALATGDFRFLGIATDDKLHQPHREKLIPGMRDVFEAAKSVDENAAVALSGSGPTIVAFCTANSDEIGKNMQQAFLEHDINSRVMLLSIDDKGAEILEH
jgi:homoserine kinase